VAERLLQLCQQDDGCLYALFDAARDEAILRSLSDVEHCESLYRGSRYEKHFAMAPFLVQLVPDSELFEKFTTHGWGESWGVLLACGQPFDALLEHFRKFILVRRQTEEDEDQHFFRFYDPRILRTYLPTCTDSEIRLLFGPVRRFYAESACADALLVFDEGKRETRASDGGGAISKPLSQADATAGEQNHGLPAAEPVLTIRKEQVLVFRHHLVREFEDRAMADLRDAFPSKTSSMGDSELRAYVRDGLERAERHRVRIERHVVAYLRYMTKYGVDFDDTYPEAGEILRNERIPGSVKIQRLAAWHRARAAQ